MSESAEISKIYDAEKFVRHDMLPAGNLCDSVFESFIEYDAFIVLIDQYTKGYNPNVWFEMGIVSTLEKPMILIGKNQKKLPFHAVNINVLGIGNELMDMFKKDIDSFKTINSMESAIKRIFTNKHFVKDLQNNFYIL